MSSQKRTDLLCQLKTPYQIYKLVPALREPKQQAVDRQALTEQAHFIPKWSRIKNALQRYTHDITKYCHHRAFLPSFSVAILYFTVLGFAGQMVTYLLVRGYNSWHVGAARTLSVVFEIAATWLTPLLMARVGPIRAGFWSLNSQLICLVGAAGVFWGVQDPIVAATGLVVGTILSRVGLRGVELCAMIIVQEVSNPRSVSHLMFLVVVVIEPPAPFCMYASNPCLPGYQEVEAESRGSFSTIEASFQNFFEMCSFASTMVFSRPAEFQWPVLMSCVAVFVAAALYAYFVRERRGHLLHVSACVERKSYRYRVRGLELERVS